MMIRVAVVIGALLLVSGCSPIVSHHGFNAMPQLESWINNRTIIKNEILSRFGSPSFMDSDQNGTTFYYTSFTKERFAFFDPEITERKIAVLRFKNDQFDSHNIYTLADGKDISISGKKTPTYGKELTVIQQLLSNVGRFNNIPGKNGIPDGSIGGRIPGGL